MLREDCPVILGSLYVCVREFHRRQHGLPVQLPSDRELHLSSSGCITDGQGRGSGGYFQGDNINKWILADKEIFLILC